VLLGLVLVMALGQVLASSAAENHVSVSDEFGSSQSDSVGGAAASGTAVWVVGGANEALPGQTWSGGEDAWARRYNANGSLDWTVQFGTSNSERANDVAAGPGGTCYVVGQTVAALSTTDGPHGAYDVFVRKLDASGSELWTRQLGGSDPDYGMAVTTDPSGRVWVAAETSSTLGGHPSTGDYDGWVLVLDPDDGSLLGQGKFGTTDTDGVGGIACTSDGRVGIVGETKGEFPGKTRVGSLGGYEAFTLVYDSVPTTLSPANGYLWCDQSCPVSGTAYGEGLAAEGATGLWAVGSVSGTMPGGARIGLTDGWVRKFNHLSGAVLDTEQFGTADGFDTPYGVSLDRVGNLYVAGRTNATWTAGYVQQGSYDAFVAKLPGAAQPEWVSQFGASGLDSAICAVTDGNDALWVGSQVTGSIGGAPFAGGGEDVLVRRYTADNTAPVAAVSSPVFSTISSTTTAFRVAWAAVDASPPSSGIDLYEVRSRIAPSGAWSTWQSTPTAGSAQFAGTPGRTYNFQARATDGALNAGAWSAMKATSVPFDQNSMLRAGAWLTRSSGSLYQGSSKWSGAAGASAAIKCTSARTIRLLATMSPDSGMADIYLGSTKLKRIDLYSGSVKYRQHLLIKSYTTPTTTILRVIVARAKRTASTNYRVELDGVVVTR
jgi:hypothetical protein